MEVECFAFHFGPLQVLQEGDEKKAGAGARGPEKWIIELQSVVVGQVWLLAGQ